MALRDQKVKIPAGAEIPFAVNGDYLRIKKSNIEVRVKSKNGDDFGIKQGDEVSIKNFEYVYLKNETAGDEEVEIYTGKDERVGSAELSGSVAVSSMPNVAVSSLPANNGGVTQGRVSLTNVNQQVRPAKANRKYCILQNNDASAFMRVTVDGAAATPTQGFRIGPGETFEFENFNVTGAINCIMETNTGAVGNVEWAEG